jgi:tetratricopeptide (TPR) repeat protein
MAIEKYRDFILVANDVEKDEAGVIQFSVEVFASPRGGGLRATKQKISPDLRKELGRLERRKLDVDGIISLGEKLADLLLPGEMRELFKGCLDMLRKGQGLRLRLRLDPTLASIPWEYIYVRRAGGERDSTGFLVLDPRVSIARHEAMPIPGDFDDTPKKRRLLVALASPEGEVPLDLDKERDNLKEALRDVPGIGLDLVENATLQKLGDELIGGADIFHFAGHGTFGQAGAEARYGTGEGEGAILLVAEDGSGAPMPAEELAVNLRGRGVELVVLGACQTGRRGEGNVWSGIAAALMKAGIPAAVAMQYGIWDDAAIAFNRSFYRVLAAGLPLDYAVSAGRLAAFNRCHPVREHLELGRCYRDWGVPVLYLRSEQDFVLPAIEDAGQREAVTRTAKADAERRERELAEKGVPAPALTGKSFSEAEDLTSEAGVVVREKGRRYHSSAPVNAVIEQYPEAGAPVEAGAAIEVVLSRGPEIAPVVVPAAAERKLGKAEAERPEREIEIGKRTLETKKKTRLNTTLMIVGTILVFTVWAYFIGLPVFMRIVFEITRDRMYEKRSMELSKLEEEQVEASLQNYRDGQIYFKQGRYEEALALFEESLKKDPYFDLAMADKGFTWHKLGDSKKALNILDEAIEINPRLMIAYYFKGIVYLDLGAEIKSKQHLGKALEFFDKAIELEPGFANAYLEKGVTLFRLRDYRGALTAYQKVIEIDPERPDVYEKIGLVWARRGEFEKAISYYDKAIDKDPQYALAFFGKGWALKNLDLIPRARECFRIAHELDESLEIPDI